MRWFLVLSILMSAPLAQAQEPSPAPAMPDKQSLPALLDALADAQDTAAATGLEVRILRQWEQAAGPVVAMLLARSSHEIDADDANEALADIDAALTLAPENIEAFHHRAMARYHKGDVSGAYHDLDEVLRREPRQFAAWRSLAEIAEAQGNNRAAYAAWQKLMALDPKTKGGEQKLEELKRKVEGEKS